MNKIIDYLKIYLLFLIMLISYLIFISIFYYFEIINYKTVSIINYIALIIMFFIIGYKISNIRVNRGYLNGFIISSVLVIIFSLITLIMSKITFSSLVYYLSLILSSMIGGIIGINKKEN